MLSSLASGERFWCLPCLCVCEESHPDAGACWEQGWKPVCEPVGGTQGARGMARFHHQPKRHPVLTPAASSWCICWERAQLHWHQPRINVAKSGSSIQLSALGPPQELQEGCFPLGYPARRCPHLWADGAADTRTGAGGGKFLPPCAPALISWPPWARDRFPLSANISHKTIQLCP